MTQQLAVMNNKAAVDTPPLFGDFCGGRHLNRDCAVDLFKQITTHYPREEQRLNLKIGIEMEKTKTRFKNHEVGI